eukprot:361401-Chlamydomonas_euryale.AAC.10
MAARVHAAAAKVPGLEKPRQCLRVGRRWRPARVAPCRWGAAGVALAAAAAAPAPAGAAAAAAAAVVAPARRRPLVVMPRPEAPPHMGGALSRRAPRRPRGRPCSGALPATRRCACLT